MSRNLVTSFVRKCVSTLLRDVAHDLSQQMNETREDIAHEMRKVDENNKALDYLARLLQPRHPWTGWTMNPSAIGTIVSDILINDRSTVVECGAGLSTLYTAKALSAQGGRLISFENELAWAQRVQQELVELGLEAYVQVAHAELAEWWFNERVYLWYSEHVVRDQLERITSVDLLVVDGPPQSVCHHSRYPAVPVIAPYLGDRYAVVLHDIYRIQEKEIVELWRQEISADFINDYRARGVSYGRQGSYYEV